MSSKMKKEIASVNSSSTSKRIETSNRLNVYNTQLAQIDISNHSISVHDGEFDVWQLKRQIRLRKATLQSVEIRDCWSQMKRFEMVQTLFLEADLMLIEFPILNSIAISNIIITQPVELSEEWKEHYDSLLESSILQVGNELRTHIMLRESVGVESKGRIIVKQLCFDSKHAFYYLLHAIQRQAFVITSVSFVNILDLKINPLKVFCEQIRSLPNLTSLHFVNVLFNDQSILQVRYLLNWKSLYLKRLVFKQVQLSEFQLQRLFIDAPNFNLQDMTNLKEIILKCDSKLTASELFKQVRSSFDKLIQENKVKNLNKKNKGQLSKNDEEIQEKKTSENKKEKLFQPKKVIVRNELKEWPFSSFQKEISQPLKMLLFQLSQTNFCSELDIAAVSLIGAPQEILVYLLKAVCDSLSLHVFKLQNYPDLLSMLLKEFRKKNKMSLKNEDQEKRDASAFDLVDEDNNIAGTVEDNKLQNKRSSSSDSSFQKPSKNTNQHNDKGRDNQENNSNQSTHEAKTLAEKLGSFTKMINLHNLKSIVFSKSTGNIPLNSNSTKTCETKSALALQANIPSTISNNRSNNSNEELKMIKGLRGKSCEPTSPEGRKKRNSLGENNQNNNNNEGAQQVGSAVEEGKPSKKDKLTQSQLLQQTAHPNNKSQNKSSEIFRKRKILEELCVSASAHNEFGESSLKSVCGLMQFSEKLSIDFNNSFMTKEGMRGLLDGLKQINECEGVECQQLSILGCMASKRKIQVDAWFELGFHLLTCLDLNTLIIEATLTQSQLLAFLKGLVAVKNYQQLRSLSLKITSESTLEISDLLNILLENLQLTTLSLESPLLISSHGHHHNLNNPKSSNQHHSSSLSSLSKIKQKQLNPLNNNNGNKQSSHKVLIPSHFSLNNNNNHISHLHHQPSIQYFNQNLTSNAFIPSKDFMTNQTLQIQPQFIPSNSITNLTIHRFEQSDWNALIFNIAKNYQNLIELDISMNSLNLEFVMSLAACTSFGALKNLKKLGLHSNPLRTPPANQNPLSGLNNPEGSFTNINIEMISPSHRQEVQVLKAKGSQIKTDKQFGSATALEFSPKNERNTTKNNFEQTEQQLPWDGNPNETGIPVKPKQRQSYDFTFTKFSEVPHRMNPISSIIATEKINPNITMNTQQFNSRQTKSKINSDALLSSQSGLNVPSFLTSNETLIRKAMRDLFSLLFAMESLSELDLSKTGMTYFELDAIDTAIHNPLTKNRTLNFHNINLADNPDIKASDLCLKKLNGVVGIGSISSNSQIEKQQQSQNIIGINQQQQQQQQQQILEPLKLNTQQKSISNPSSINWIKLTPSLDLTPKNGNLIELNLCGCELQGDVVTKIINIIGSKDFRLRSLDLSENTYMTVNQWHDMIATILSAQGRFLQTLKLTSCRLDDRHAMEISSVIDNFCTENKAEINNTYQYATLGLDLIDLSQNPAIQKEGWFILTKALLGQVNLTLRQIKMRSCAINNVKVQYMLDGLKEANLNLRATSDICLRCLEEIDLKDNPIPQSLQIVIQRNFLLATVLEAQISQVQECKPNVLKMLQSIDMNRENYQKTIERKTKITGELNSKPSARELFIGRESCQDINIILPRFFNDFSRIEHLIIHTDVASLPKLIEILEVLSSEHKKQVIHDEDFKEIATFDALTLIFEVPLAEKNAAIYQTAMKSLSSKSGLQSSRLLNKSSDGSDNDEPKPTKKTAKRTAPITTVFSTAKRGFIYEKNLPQHHQPQSLPSSALHSANPQSYPVGSNALKFVGSHIKPAMITLGAPNNNSSSSSKSSGSAPKFGVNNTNTTNNHSSSNKSKASSSNEDEERLNDKEAEQKEGSIYSFCVQKKTTKKNQTDKDPGNGQNIWRTGSPGQQDDDQQDDNSDEEEMKDESFFMSKAGEFSHVEEACWESIITNFYSLSPFKKLVLKECHIDGRILQRLSQITSLESLDLSGNQRICLDPIGKRSKALTELEGRKIESKWVQGLELLFDLDRLQEISFANTSMGRGFARRLSESINKAKEGTSMDGSNDTSLLPLRTIDLSGASEAVSSTEWYNLIRSLISNCKLRKLNISNCNFSRGNVQGLLNGFLNSDNTQFLEEVNLSGNKGIYATEWGGLMVSLFGQFDIRLIDISNSAIYDKKLEKIVSSLFLPKMKSLERFLFSNNQIHNGDNLFMLFSLLCQAPNIKEIDVSNCGLTKKSNELFNDQVQLMASQYSALKILRLNGNPMIFHSFSHSYTLIFSLLLNANTKFTQLTELHLDNCLIDTYTTSLFIQILVSLNDKSIVIKSLSTLSLQGNRIKAYQYAQLLPLIMSVAVSLQTLMIGGNTVKNNFHGDQSSLKDHQRHYRNSIQAISVGIQRIPQFNIAKLQISDEETVSGEDWEHFLKILFIKSNMSLHHLRVEGRTGQRIKDSQFFGSLSRLLLTKQFVNKSEIFSNNNNNYPSDSDPRVHLDIRSLCYCVNNRAFVVSSEHWQGLQKNGFVSELESGRVLQTTSLDYEARYWNKPISDRIVYVKLHNDMSLMRFQDAVQTDTYEQNLKLRADLFIAMNYFRRYLNCESLMNDGIFQQYQNYTTLVNNNNNNNNQIVINNNVNQQQIGGAQYSPNKDSGQQVIHPIQPITKDNTFRETLTSIRETAHPINQQQPKEKSIFRENSGNNLHENPNKDLSNVPLTQNPNNNMAKSDSNTQINNMMSSSANSNSENTMLNMPQLENNQLIIHFNYTYSKLPIFQAPNALTAPLDFSQVNLQKILKGFQVLTFEYPLFIFFVQTCNLFPCESIPDFFVKLIKSLATYSFPKESDSFITVQASPNFFLTEADRDKIQKAMNKYKNSRDVHQGNQLVPFSNQNINQASHNHLPYTPNAQMLQLQNNPFQQQNTHSSQIHGSFQFQQQQIPTTRVSKSGFQQQGFIASNLPQVALRKQSQNINKQRQSQISQQQIQMSMQQFPQDQNNSQYFLPMENSDNLLLHRDMNNNNNLSFLLGRQLQLTPNDSKNFSSPSPFNQSITKEGLNVNYRNVLEDENQSQSFYNRNQFNNSISSNHMIPGNLGSKSMLFQQQQQQQMIPLSMQQLSQIQNDHSPPKKFLKLNFVSQQNPIFSSPALHAQQQSSQIFYQNQSSNQLGQKQSQSSQTQQLKQQQQLQQPQQQSDEIEEDLDLSQKKMWTVLCPYYFSSSSTANLEEIQVIRRIQKMPPSELELNGMSISAIKTIYAFCFSNPYFSGCQMDYHHSVFVNTSLAWSLRESVYKQYVQSSTFKPRPFIHFIHTLAFSILQFFIRDNVFYKYDNSAIMLDHYYSTKNRTHNFLLCLILIYHVFTSIIPFLFMNSTGTTWMGHFMYLIFAIFTLIVEYFLIADILKKILHLAPGIKMFAATKSDKRQGLLNCLKETLVNQSLVNYKFLIYMHYLIYSQFGRFNSYSDFCFLVLCLQTNSTSIFYLSAVILGINKIIASFRFFSLTQKVRSAEEKHLPGFNITKFYEAAIQLEFVGFSELLNIISPYNVTKIPKNAFTEFLMPQISGQSMNQRIYYQLLRITCEDIPQIFLQLAYLSGQSNILAYISLCMSVMSFTFAVFKIMSIRPSIISQLDFDELKIQKQRDHVEVLAQFEKNEYEMLNEIMKLHSPPASLLTSQQNKQSSHSNILQ